MLIKWLEAEDFRGLAGVNFFEFGALTEIIGGNGTGKSTIGEGIAFALTGADIHGKAGSTDRLMHKGCIEMRIAIGIEVDGRDFEIERRSTRFKNKTETQILINKQPGNQEQIDSFIGDRKQFLAAFLPDYFCNLPGTDARLELVKLLPIPSDDSVRDRMKEDDPLLAKEIAGVSLIDPDNYISKQKKYLKELNDEKIRLEGQESEAKLTIDADVPSEIPIDTSAIDQVKESIRQIESAKPQLVDTSELEQKRLAAFAEYNALQSGLDFEEKFIDHPCEKCGHVNHINLNEEQDEKNMLITEKMAAINIEQERLYADINAINTKNKEAKEVFEKENAETLRKLRGDLQVREANLNLVKQHNLKIQVVTDARNKALERIKHIAEEKERVEKLIQETEQLIKAAKAFHIKRCEMQLSEVAGILDHVSIRLFDIVKSTGEIKDVFVLEYDGKEYRVLSTSEKYRCYLEISKLVRKLTGKKYPVFIDNAESITHFEKPDSQLITASVAKSTPLIGEEGELIGEIPVPLTVYKEGVA